MKVYVVLEGIFGEHRAVLGVFSTADLARQRADESLDACDILEAAVDAQDMPVEV